MFIWNSLILTLTLGLALVGLDSLCSCTLTLVGASIEEDEHDRTNASSRAEGRGDPAIIANINKSMKNETVKL